MHKNIANSPSCKTGKGLQRDFHLQDFQKKTLKNLGPKISRVFGFRICSRFLIWKYENVCRGSGCREQSYQRSGLERRAASRWRYFLYTGNAALNSCRLHPCGLVPLNWSCLSWEFDGQFFPSLTFWHIFIAFCTQGQISSIPLDGCIKRLHLSYACEKTLWVFFFDQLVNYGYSLYFCKTTSLRRIPPWIPPYPP